MQIRMRVALYAAAAIATIGNTVSLDAETDLEYFGMQ